MKIQVFPLMYEGQKRIGIRPLGFDRNFPTLMKKNPGSRWTPNKKCWHIPYQQEAYAGLKRLFGEGQVIVLQQRPFYDLGPRKSQKLPGVFSEEEVASLFSVIQNLKHKTILTNY